MTLGRVKGAGWAVNEELTSAQITALDLNVSNAVDRTVSGDTIAGVIALSGVGRIIPTVALGADADTSYQVSGGNLVIRVTSATTASRQYVLSATNAQHGDMITVYCESSFSSSYYISLCDQAGTEVFKLGNGMTHDGAFAVCMYTSSGGTGWRLMKSPLSHMGYQTFTANGTFTAPSNVSNVILIGWGGGGGGGSGRTGTGVVNEYPRGGGGGAGALQGVTRVAVTPASTYAVVIGAGGAGGTGLASGDPGTDTTFGSLATFRGAEGGKSFNYLTADTRVARGGCREYASGMVHTFWENSIGPGEGGHGGVSGTVAGGLSTDGRNGGQSAFYVGYLRQLNGADSGSYRGGGSGGCGGSGPGSNGGVGAEGGAANNAGVGAAPATSGGSYAGGAATNGGAGGGGGGGGGCGSGGGGAASNGGTGDSGQLTVIWMK